MMICRLYMCVRSFELYLYTRAITPNHVFTNMPRHYVQSCDYVYARAITSNPVYVYIRVPLHVRKTNRNSTLTNHKTLPATLSARFDDYLIAWKVHGAVSVVIFLL